MNETIHKKTKSVDFNGKKTKYIDKKKESSYITTFNKTMIKTNLLSTSRRNISSFDYQDVKKKYIFDDSSLNSDDLKHESDLAMADYKYESLTGNKNDDFEKVISRDFNNIFNTNKSYIRSSNLSLLESINDESQLKVCINLQDYNNPVKSFSTIKKNQIIYDSMVQNYYEIQKKKFSDYIKKIEHTDRFNNTNYSRIKITSIAPKTNNEAINIPNNSNEKKEQCIKKFFLYIIILFS